MSPSASQPQPSFGLLVTLAAACGFAVANIYYNQPLLPLIGASFGRSTSESGQVATITQFGYAIGLLLFVPLGDRMARRPLILALMALNLVSLLATEFAPSFAALLGASLAVGVTAVSVQIMIPAAAALATPERRGKVVGMMTSGLSSGILLGRCVSGLVGAHWGWRPMFGLAALLELAMLAVLAVRMPASAGTLRISYGQLLLSLLHLWRTERLLRRAVATSSMMFASFCAFWASLAFILAQPPLLMGSDIAGLFGLSTLVGVLFSPMIGRLTDRLGTATIWLCGALGNLAAFIGLAIAGPQLAVMALVAVLLDFGARTNLIANQTSIYALSGEARSRLNTVYATIHFCGGAIGSACGVLVVGWAGPRGVAVTGLGFVTLALIAHGHFSRPRH